MASTRIKIVALLFQFLFLSAHLYPQPNDLAFEHITVIDGLPENSVRVILQDHLGFMWFGTLNGLVKFDGYDMTIYQPVPDDAGSFNGRYILSLHKDRTGDIWIGTRFEGLFRFDRTTETFRQFNVTQLSSETHDTLAFLQKKELNTIPSSYVSAIAGRQQSDELWIATLGGGLSRLNITNLSFKHYQHNQDDSTTIPTDDLHDIHPDRKGNIWIASSSGLINFVPEKQEFTLYQPEHDKDNDDFNDFYTLCQDRSGTLWIGTLGSGIFTFDPSSETFKHYLHNPDNPNSLSHNQVYSIYPDQSGLIWIATLGGGLNVFDKKKNIFKSYKDNSYDPNSMSINLVFSIFEDRTGVLWVGTWRGGLNKLDRGKQRFRQYQHNPVNSNSLSDNHIMSIYEDWQRTLWIGTWAGGLNRFDKEKNLFRHYQHDPANPHSISDNQIMSIYEDRQGMLWIGTFDGGLNRYDKEKNLFKRYQHDPHDPHSLGNNWVLAIYEDRFGVLWIGTVGGGLNRYDPATKTFTRFRVAKNNQILKIYEDHNGTLWIGTNGDGLQQFDREKEVFVIYGQDEFLAVSAIHEDKSGKLWLGTFERGLFLFDRDSGRFLNFGEKTGLINNWIWAILEDGRGNLWISTAKGISRFDPLKKSFKNFTNSDGLLAPYRSGACKSQFTGEMYFGGRKGLTVFHPDSIIDNPYPPQIALTEIKLLNKPVKIGAGSPLKEATSITQEIRLAYWQNDISFGFAALHFNNPQKNEYAYFLENYEKEWRYVGKQRIASYTNLDPGEYIFRVKASNNDGVWNEEGTSLRIIITPPWWQSWWAYSIYALLILGTLYGIRRYELSRQRFKHQMELEHVEAEKFQELNRMKSRFFANISHEFRTPITLMLGPLQKLISQPGSEPFRETFLLMHRNGQRLLRLVNQLLDLSKLETDKMELQARPENILEVTRQLTMAFESLAGVNDIELKFVGPKEPLTVYLDREHYEKIISNLLSNALKFTPEEGKIEVEVSVAEREGETVKRRNGEEKPPALNVTDSPFLPFPDSSDSRTAQYVQIRISDTGTGIPPDRLPHIFDRFYQAAHTHTKDSQGTGIGLALTKELVELHHGEIEVTSEVGKGTTFTVRLPLGKEHLREKEISDSPKHPGQVGMRNAELKEEDTVISPILEPLKSMDELGVQDASSFEKSAIRNPKSEIVLIVEDNPDMRTYICEILEESYKVVEASDGQQGFDQAAELIPDIIISDVMMPEMDGFQFCEKIKTDERTSHIPVILLTAKSSGESKLEGLETGADDYLIKPFDSDELRVRVKNLIEQRCKLRERFRRELALEPKEIATTSADERFLQKVMNAIEQHIEEPEFGVTELSDLIGMSRSQFYRKLTALTDQSPLEFMRHIKLKRAASLLEQQAGNISEIAYRVGFNNPAYFAECFRKLFGVSPREYTSPFKN